MARKNPIHPGYMYFLTLTVVDWIDVFTRPIYRHVILDSLRFCQKEKGMEIYAWCLMSNHMHVIASAAHEKILLSGILRDFKHYTSNTIVSMIRDRDGGESRDWMTYRFKRAADFHPKIKNAKFWQEGNEAKEIHTNEFLQQKIDYIHNNPVVAEWGRIS